MYSHRVLRTLTLLAGTTPVLISGCGGGSSSSAPTPAQFAAKTGTVCRAVAPRLKQTSAQITSLDAGKGNPLDKLPKLAGLLGQLGGEFTDLRTGLGAITAPAAQKVPFATFLRDLGKLEALTKQGTGMLTPGTITGLRQFKALGPELNAATSTLGGDATKVPGLSACNNLS